MKKRIGIFGGTFSPPHFGHINAAKVFFDQLKLDVLYIMPNNVAPHKMVSYNNPDLRLEMCKIAFKEISKSRNIIVSDYEINKGGISYTAETLQHFANDGNELFLLCGTDMFYSLNTWYKPDVICSLSTIVMIRRDSDRAMTKRLYNKRTYLKKRFNASIIFLKSDAVEISSTEIRDAIKNGKDYSSFIPQNLSDFINQNQLYN